MSEELPGSARLELVQGVTLLHEEDAVLEAMLSGWATHRLSRNLTHGFVMSDISSVRSFFAFTDQYPWHWTPAMMEQWSTELLLAQHLSLSTRRSKQGALRSFCAYITSPSYKWPEECERRFGTHPIQVCVETNTITHNSGTEGLPARRPLTRRELQDLFDLGDARVDRCREFGRKGAIIAYRDVTAMKVAYAWGLRCNETVNLGVYDFTRNPKSPEFGEFGNLRVRFGKGSRGSGPRPRTVLTVMGWAVGAVQDYIGNVRPMLPGADSSRALWLTERGTKLAPSSLSTRFTLLARELGWGKEVTLHSLRHSYVTHLIEDGVSQEFVSEQVGHAYRSTTGIYTSISSERQNAMMREAIDLTLRKRES